MAAFDGRIVLVQAPAGYGKTTLASQLAEQDGRPAAWLTLRDADNDPVRLTYRLLTALEGLAPTTSASVPLLEIRAEPSTIELMQVVPATLASRSPVLLVLDDVHELRHAGSVDLVRTIVSELPTESRVILVSRVDPDIEMARLRATRDLLEVRTRHLAMGVDDTRELLDRMGVHLGEVQLLDLHRCTEGWAAGLTLAAMSLRHGGLSLEDGVSGRHRDISDYFFEEVLSRQPPEIVAFLLATSIPDRFCASLCNELTGRADAAEILEHLEADNAFLVPLDSDRSWYRYHALFQDLLRAEAQRDRPDQIPALLAKAATWHEHRDLPAEAFEYARRGGDFDRAGRVLLGAWDGYSRQGRMETLRMWVDRCSDEDITSDPKLSIAASWIVGILGQPERARRYLTAAEQFDLTEGGEAPDGATTLHASLLNLRSAAAFDGIPRMLLDADALCESESATRSRAFLAGLRSRGVAHLLLGRPDGALADFREMVELTRNEPAAAHISLFASGYASLAAADLGSWPAAQRFWSESETLAADLGDGLFEGIPGVVAGLTVHVRANRVEPARGALERALTVIPLTVTAPWLHADLALRCAAQALLLDRRDVAEAMLERAEVACEKLIDAGEIPDRIARLAQNLARPDVLALLTPAEMRVLRQLSTHRTLQEIADELYVSRTTIKTHVGSIYSKLGVASRAEAVGTLSELTTS